MKNTYKTSAFALFIGFFSAAVIVIISSKNPLNSLLSFFTGPFSSVYYIGSLLNTTGLLLTAACGAFISLKAGDINLGGEGQVYVGGFITVLVLNSFKITTESSFMYTLTSIILALVASITITSLIAILSALLKIYRNISILLSSFLLSGAIIPCITYAVSDTFRDKARNLLAMPFIADKVRFSKILPPSPLNLSFFLSLCVFFVLYFLLYKTQKGMRFRICGTAPEFATYSGYNVPLTTITGMAASGALHGLCGFFAVIGTYYTCHSGFYMGYGWNALTIALIAQTNPFFLIPASFLLSYLVTASDYSTMSIGMNFDITYIIQAVILLFITVKAGKQCK